MGLEPPTTCDKLELALKTGKNENEKLYLTTKNKKVKNK